MKFTKSISLSALLLIMAAGFTVGCSSKVSRLEVEDKVQEAETAQQEAREKTAEAVKTAETYAVQHYGPYIKEVEAKVEKYRPQIEQLEKEVDTAAAKPEVHAKLKAAYDAIVQHRSELSQELQNLRGAQQDAAVDIKGKVDVALGSLERELNQSKTLPR